MGVDCPACGAPTARGTAVETPAMQVVAAAFRRTRPQQWPNNGLPVNYYDYPSIYDILLVRSANGELSLPSTPAKDGQDPATTAASRWRRINAKRAVFVDCLVDPMAATSKLLYWLPVDTSAESGDGTQVELAGWNADWYSLQTVLDSLHGLIQGTDLQFSAATKAQLASLDRWLMDSHQLQPTVLTLWYPSASKRLRIVSKNKWFGQKAATEKANSFINPLFQSGLLFAPASSSSQFDRAMSASPPARSRGETPVGPSSTQTWGDKYPLHRAACEGDVAEVRARIKGGWAANEEDDDSWTPLHYASWYGQEGVVRLLMEDWKGGPNMKTESGATALHFAARNGFPEIVKVLLACPIVDPSAEDNEKQTPLSLCETMRQRQWDEVSNILRNPGAFQAINRFHIKSTESGHLTLTEHRIRLLDGSVKVLRVPAEGLTVDDLRNAVAGLCHVPEEYYHVFSIWVGSPNLDIALDGNQDIRDVLDKWKHQVETLCEPEQFQTNKHPQLSLKRSPFVSLREERKNRSPVAIKLLYDQALHHFLSGHWPVTVDQAVHLAGLLMQIRFGDHKSDKHKSGFLLDDLNTFIPPHLLHNQLKSSQWERRIFQAHKTNNGKTDILLLHRLFLQYCWQWPFYNGTIFTDCELVRQKGRAFGAHRNEPLKVCVGPEWLCIIFQETNSLKLTLTYDEVRPKLDDAQEYVTLQLHCDESKLAGLEQFLRGQNTPIESLHIVSKKAPIIYQHMAICLEHKLNEYRKQEERRMQQRGQGADVTVVDAAEVLAQRNAEKRQYEMRKGAERSARYHMIQSIGQAADASLTKLMSQMVFEKYAHGSKEGLVANIADLKTICYDLGYWLGSEFDGARRILGGAGSSTFSFRDLVSWWSQSKRNWLFLLDDAAFSQRKTVTEMFQKLDTERLGAIYDEKVAALARSLLSENLTTKTEESCILGLDPEQRGVCMFNDFIDWCSRQSIIAERSDLG